MSNDSNDKEKVHDLYGTLSIRYEYLISACFHSVVICWRGFSPGGAASDDGMDPAIDISLSLSLSFCRIFIGYDKENRKEEGKNRRK